jgi:hypothetical protein
MSHRPKGPKYRSLFARGGLPMRPDLEPDPVRVVRSRPTREG